MCLMAPGPLILAMVLVRPAPMRRASRLAPVVSKLEMRLARQVFRPGGGPASCGTQHWLPGIAHDRLTITLSCCRAGTNTSDITMNSERAVISYITCDPIR